MLAVTAVVGIVAFVVNQLRSKAPVVDLRVLRHRSLWAGSILSTVIGMVLYGALFAIPIFAGTILQYTSQQIGMLLLPSALASAVAMPIAAKLAGQHRPSGADHYRRSDAPRGLADVLRAEPADGG